MVAALATNLEGCDWLMMMVVVTQLYCHRRRIVRLLVLLLSGIVVMRFSFQHNSDTEGKEGVTTVTVDRVWLPTS